MVWCRTNLLKSLFKPHFPQVPPQHFQEFPNLELRTLMEEEKFCLELQSDLFPICLQINFSSGENDHWTLIMKGPFSSEESRTSFWGFHIIQSGR